MNNVLNKVTVGCFVAGVAVGLLLCYLGAVPA